MPFSVFSIMTAAMLDVVPDRYLNICNQRFCLLHSQIKSNQSLPPFGHPIPTESTYQSTLVLMDRNHVDHRLIECSIRSEDHCLQTGLVETVYVFGIGQGVE